MTRQFVSQTLTGILTPLHAGYRTAMQDNCLSQSLTGQPTPSHIKIGILPHRRTNCTSK